MRVRPVCMGTLVHHEQTVRLSSRVNEWRRPCLQVRDEVLAEALAQARPRLLHVRDRRVVVLETGPCHSLL